LRLDLTFSGVAGISGSCPVGFKPLRRTTGWGPHRHLHDPERVPDPDDGGAAASPVDSPVVTEIHAAWAVQLWIEDDRRGFTVARGEMLAGRCLVVQSGDRVRVRMSGSHYRLACLGRLLDVITGHGVAAPVY
jgi:hypothetical protein